MKVDVGLLGNRALDKPSLESVHRQLSLVAILAQTIQGLEHQLERGCVTLHWLDAPRRNLDATELRLRTNYVRATLLMPAANSRERFTASLPCFANRHVELKPGRVLRQHRSHVRLGRTG
jgi:hypothetical protein